MIRWNKGQEEKTENRNIKAENKKKLLKYNGDSNEISVRTWWKKYVNWGREERNMELKEWKRSLKKGKKLKMGLELKGWSKTFQNK